MEDDVIAERFRDLHETNIERNSARTRTTAPSCGGVAETTAIVMIAVEFSVIFEAVREIFFGLMRENFLFGVAGTLSVRVAERDFFANKFAVEMEETFDGKVTSMLRNGHLEAAGRRYRKTDATREWVFADDNFTKFLILENHRSWSWVKTCLSWVV